MADYIERGPLLEAFKAKCCEDCPGGYDRAKCHSWCDAADEIALVEDAPAVVPDVQRWRDPDEELAKRLIPIVVNQMCEDHVPTEEEALKWLQQPASCLKE